jgi:hypothetical protein
MTAIALSRTQQPQYAASQVFLVLTKTPATAQAVRNQYLLDAGTLDVAGDYECSFATDGMNTIEAVLMPSAVTGTVTPTLRSMYANREATRDSDAGVAFGAGVKQTLTLTNLRGASIAKVTFTLDAGESITFARGSDAASPTAFAEANGL